MERELGNGQLGMERSGNEETTMYKGWLSSPPPHIYFLFFRVLLRSCFPVFFGVYREKEW